MQGQGLGCWWYLPVPPAHLWGEMKLWEGSFAPLLLPLQVPEAQAGLGHPREYLRGMG